MGKLERRKVPGVNEPRDSKVRVRNNFGRKGKIQAL